MTGTFAVECSQRNLNVTQLIVCDGLTQNLPSKDLNKAGLDGKRKVVWTAFCLLVKGGKKPLAYWPEGSCLFVCCALFFLYKVVKCLVARKFSTLENVESHPSFRAQILLQCTFKKFPTQNGLMFRKCLRPLSMTGWVGNGFHLAKVQRKRKWSIQCPLIWPNFHTLYKP